MPTRCGLQASELKTRNSTGIQLTTIDSLHWLILSQCCCNPSRITNRQHQARQRHLSLRRHHTQPVSLPESRGYLCPETAPKSLEETQVQRPHRQPQVEQLPHVTAESCTHSSKQQSRLAFRSSQAWPFRGG